MSDRLTLGPVVSPTELDQAVIKISEKFPKAFLLFRGQNNLYPTIRSGLSRPDTRFEPEIEKGWSSIIGNILGQNAVSIDNMPLRKAILQHYGMKTHYVDVTSDIYVAAWFALNKYKSDLVLYGGFSLRVFDRVRYTPRPNGLGYILVIVISDPEEMESNRHLFDITNLKSFVRPQRQKAWLLYDRRPLLPDPNKYWLANIILDCSKMTSDLESSYLFPSTSDDPGYEALLRTPFVEVPEQWFKLQKKNKDKKSDNPPIKIERRALSIPEYAAESESDEYDHKWKDMTLTETGPMQCWAGWEYELSKKYTGFKGNIKESTKITLSPIARDLIYKAQSVILYRWPELGADDLLFTFSQWGHDKVYDIEYPYHGVWLHREHDILIEHPITSDEDCLRVHAGHAYKFVGQQLHRQDIADCCKCGSPENHDKRVQAMLRLSALIESEVLAILPHPQYIPKWYIVL